MPLRNLAHLYRVRLRSRWAAELLALAGIAVGVALVFSALVANASLSGSVRQLTEGIVGDADLQLAARGPDGFGLELLPRLRATPGVRSVAPVVDIRANVVGPEGRRSVQLIGGDARFARAGGPLLRPLARLGVRRSEPGLVLPAPLAGALGVAAGDRLEVEASVGTFPVRAVELLGDAEIGSLAASPVALAPLPLAQALAGVPGRVSRIFVTTQPGREERVEAALRDLAGGRLNVAPADAEVAFFERAAYPTSQSTGLFSVLSALVGFLFALSATLLTVPQRRRLIGDLRLAGYEPRAIVAVLLFDALVLGAAGAALGLALGDQASRHLFDSVPGYLGSAFAIGSQRIVSWQSLALAAGTGLLASCLAVLAPLRDALSSRPVAPRATGAASRHERWATAAGLFAVAVTTVIAILAPAAAMVGVALLVLALLLLLPLLLRLLGAGFDAIGRRQTSPVPILAALELRSGAAKVRTLALAATGAIAVFAVVSIGGAQADLQRGLDAATRDTDSGSDVWATFRGSANTFRTIPFVAAPDRVAALKRLPEVRAVRRYGGSFLDVGDYRAWVSAPPAATRPPIPTSQIRGDADLAASRVRRGDWVILYDGIAEQLGVDVGDRVRLPTPRPIGLRVAALSTNGGWPAGTIILNAKDYTRAWGSSLPSALGVELAPGTSANSILPAVRTALGPQMPLRVETTAQRMARNRQASRAGLSRLRQISVLVLVAAMLAMAAAMGGAIWQRRPTFAALKVHGFREGQLWRALLLESAVLLGGGCLIGAVFGLYGQALLSRALETVTGFPVFYSTAGPLALAVLALVTAVAVAMLAVPGWFAVRVRAVAGLAAE